MQRLRRKRRELVEIQAHTPRERRLDERHHLEGRRVRLAAENRLALHAEFADLNGAVGLIVVVGAENALSFEFALVDEGVEPRLHARARLADAVRFEKARFQKAPRDGLFRRHEKSKPRFDLAVVDPARDVGGDLRALRLHRAVRAGELFHPRAVLLLRAREAVEIVLDALDLPLGVAVIVDAVDAHDVPIAAL